MSLTLLTLPTLHTYITLLTLLTLPSHTTLAVSIKKEKKEILCSAKKYDILKISVSSVGSVGSVGIKGIERGNAESWLKGYDSAKILTEDGK